MKFVLSDPGKVTSHGFKVDVNGLILDRFVQNPVMLAAHKHDNVIGRWENIKVDNGQLTADAVFDMEDPDAAKIAGKVERGFLRATSLGMYIIEMTQVGDECIVTKAEVVEASILAVPSDSNALAQLGTMVHLYDANKQTTTFEAVKLNFNNNQNNVMEVKGIELTPQTLVSLSISGEYTAKDVQLAVVEKDNEINRLKTELSNVHKASYLNYLDMAEKGGRISKEQKEGYAALEATQVNFEAVKKIIEATPVQTPQVTLGSLANEQSNGGDDRNKWSFLDWSKKDPKGLQELKAKNPQEFNRLKNQ